MPLADGVNVGNSGNTLLEGLLGSVRWDSPGATTQIEIYIASNQTVVFTEEGVSNNASALAPLAAETAAILQMLAIYETFLNIDFTITNTLADADIYVAFVAGTDPTIGAVPGTLGVAMPPETTANFQGGLLINRDAYKSGTAGLVQGGYDFITLIHEFGHALGLMHPHDTGGGSTVFPGVTEGQATGDLGDFNLNQGVNTMMSYNDGWQTAPQGPLDENVVFNRGFEGTPMALDIAALQFLYGTKAYNAANTLYTLKDVNAAGTFYSSVWDTGGIDEIRSNSNTSSFIDLRAATLAVADGGGGFVSRVTGIDGGFTIANGVVIENATGGGGNDTLIGNNAANVLNGRGGADIMRGFGGSDVYGVDNIGDRVDEFIAGSNGLDRINSLVNVSLVNVSGAALGTGTVETVLLLGTANIFAYGNSLGNTLVGNVGANVLAGGLGNDALTGGDGNDTFLFNTALNSTTNRDTITDMNESGNDTIRLENAIFTALTTVGALAAAAFQISTTGSLEADDRIVYNNVTGQLYYDSNGNAAGGGAQFATLDAGLALTAADFFVV